MGTENNMAKFFVIALTLIVAAAAFPTPSELDKASQAPPVFNAELATETNGKAGKVTIEVHRDWAPKGADRFYGLVKSGFFKNARVFRVVPHFVVQFGISGDPAIQSQYRSANIQ